MNNSLKLDNVSFGFKERIVSNVNLEVFGPKLISIMGINGIGKSCILKTLSGIIPPIDGDILVNNISCRNYSKFQYAKEVSILLTDKIDLEFLKVEELVLYGRAPYTNWNNEYSKDDVTVVADLMSLLNIQSLKDKFFNELSDGQKQKVLLARALAQSNNILLLDEPTTFLDIPSKIDFLMQLKRIILERNLIAIMSTHETMMMNEVIDEVWIIAENKFLKLPPAELKSSGEFKNIFGLDLN